MKNKKKVKISPQKCYEKAMRGDFSGYDRSWEAYLLKIERKKKKKKGAEQ